MIFLSLPASSLQVFYRLNNCTLHQQYLVFHSKTHSFLGAPLSMVPYPAITLCPVGYPTYIFENSLKSGILDDLIKHNISFPPSSDEMNAALKRLFPGFGRNPAEVLQEFVSSNPTITLKSHYMMNSNRRQCEYDDDGDGKICPEGWTQSASRETNEIYCFKNLGESSGSDDLCLKSAARRIQFNLYDRSFEKLVSNFLGISYNIHLWQLQLLIYLQSL